MKPLPERLLDHASLSPAVALAKWDTICEDMRRAAQRIDTVEEAGYCRTCKANPAKVGGECRTCNKWRQRHGTPRPKHLTERQPELNRRGLTA